MKNFLFILIGNLVFNTLSAQNCSYFTMKQGAFFKYEEYDSKDKMESSYTTEIIKVESSGNKTTATTKVHVYDKKEKETYTAEMPIVCENGNLIINIKDLIPKESMEAYKEMDLTLDSDNLIVPSNLSVGQKLNDGKMTMTISSSGQTIMTMYFIITDRVVEKKETITILDKEYLATKITYNMNIDMSIMKQSFKNAEWYVEGLGMVKSQQLKEKTNEVMSTTKLVEFKN